VNFGLVLKVWLVGDVMLLLENQQLPFRNQIESSHCAKGFLSVRLKVACQKLNASE
jgi:hypothetical protein